MAGVACWDARVLCHDASQPPGFSPGHPPSPALPYEAPINTPPPEAHPPNFQRSLLIPPPLGTLFHRGGGSSFVDGIGSTSSFISGGAAKIPPGRYPRQGASEAMG